MTFNLKARTSIVRELHIRHSLVDALDELCEGTIIIETARLTVLIVCGVAELMDASICSQNEYVER